MFKSLLDFIYPPRCAVCFGLIEEHVPICPECEAKLPKISHPMCVLCGTPFFGGEDHVCGSCSKSGHSFDRARAAGVYAGSMKPAIIHFKFSRKTSLSKPLGKLMTDTAMKEMDLHEIDSIIPVPLHKKRLRWRGFNQSLLLAREISEATGIWVDPLTLKRVRHTLPQTRLPFKERTENVKGAFEVSSPAFVKDRAILLVDDVTTTGSTIVECAKVLKKAGARRVEVLTAARAVQDF